MHGGSIPLTLNWDAGAPCEVQRFESSRRRGSTSVKRHYGPRDGVAADPYKIGVTEFDSLTGYQHMEG